MLDLYYAETCPYSRKVLSFLEENDVEFSPKEISDPKNYDKLMEIGQMAQVPFLVDTDNGEKMYESDVIIDYIKKKEDIK